MGLPSQRRKIVAHVRARAQEPKSGETRAGVPPARPCRVSRHRRQLAEAVEADGLETVAEVRAEVRHRGCVEIGIAADRRAGVVLHPVDAQQDRLVFEQQELRVRRIARDERLVERGARGIERDAALGP